MRTALKEMAVVVQALEDGKQVVLIRKGGIREEKQFLLYPRYEHSEDWRVKPEYAEYAEANKKSPLGAGKVRISAWAKLDEIIRTTDPARLQALDRYYVWPAWNFKKDVMASRFIFEEGDEEYYNVLVLRAYKLANPIIIEHKKEYEYVCTCHISYTPLFVDVSLEGSKPVLTDEEFTKIRDEIRAILFEAVREPVRVVG